MSWRELGAQVSLVCSQIVTINKNRRENGNERGG
jgi:hypothetical protein